MEAQVAQDLGAEPIAQADIFKSDHAALRNARMVIRPAASNLTPATP
jgi:hypothetical protein